MVHQKLQGFWSKNLTSSMQNHLTHVFPSDAEAATGKAGDDFVGWLFGP